jgi:hypothetical protein
LLVVLLVSGLLVGLLLLLTPVVALRVVTSLGLCLVGLLLLGVSTICSLG